MNRRGSHPAPPRRPAGTFTEPGGTRASCDDCRQLCGAAPPATVPRARNSDRDDRVRRSLLIPLRDDQDQISSDRPQLNITTHRHQVRLLIRLQSGCVSGPNRSAAARWQALRSSGFRAATCRIAWWARWLHTRPRLGWPCRLERPRSGRVNPRLIVDWCPACELARLLRSFAGLPVRADSPRDQAR
jgi:hypothetical protein